MSPDPQSTTPFDGESDEEVTTILEPEPGDSKVAAPPAVAAAPEPAEPAEETDTSNERIYQILVRDSSGAWKEDRQILSSSKERALDQIGEGDVFDGAAYRAVPIRSWDPIFESDVDRRTTITFSKK